VASREDRVHAMARALACGVVERSRMSGGCDIDELSVARTALELVDAVDAALRTRAAGGSKRPASAREQLVAWAKASPRGAQTKLARDLGVSKPSLSAWVNGHARPEHHHRVVLERLTGIPADAWMTESERSAWARAFALGHDDTEGT
jgi:transcriptional regulator with XRE-family HTH domain